ncbi:NAD(P)-binding protein [Polyplosphaeria fusca]|uniref:NAD(P)-binding protein n=1 Tax=Polyplosphaeria fusca TaxID=682080 RepID=A0A9P4QUD5_9PLEO|nr:NAD(P)-binding protein [Polyplosphaeria fusca]
MAHNVLITGGSGYLGGTLLACLDPSALPSHGKIYASVRSNDQALKMASYPVVPLKLDLDDHTALHDAIVERAISIIFFLVDSRRSTVQKVMIAALAEVQKNTGLPVHFLHTTGAKLFSSHVGHPTDRPILDTDPDLYALQTTCSGPYPIMNEALATNSTIIDLAEKHSVKSYIFTPCIVYGAGLGFGNPISIQTAAIVRAARAVRKVYATEPGNPTWPVCHVLDNTALYIRMLHQMLAGEEMGYGREGYYLASSGSVAWGDLYGAMAKALAKRGVVEDGEVGLVDERALEEMGRALGCSKEFVGVQLSGTCTFTAERGRRIGWVPEFGAEHVLEDAEEEVRRILEALG